MKLKLRDLDPHLLKRVAPHDYEHTDDVACAEGLQIQCPACHWADRRGVGGDGHIIMLWRDPEHWSFVGKNYSDLSLMAGRLMVTLTGGPCHARFYIKDGKVDFY